MSISFKEIGMEDEDFVYECTCELENQVFDRQKFHEVYLKSQQTEGRIGFIVLYDSKQVGFIGLQILTLLHHCDKVAEIQELYIKPDYRNKQIGKETLRFAEEYTRKEDCQTIELASRNWRTDTHRFYENNNYLKSHFKFTKRLKE